MSGALFEYIRTFSSRGVACSCMLSSARKVLHPTVGLTNHLATTVHEKLLRVLPIVGRPMQCGLILFFSLDYFLI